MAVRISQGSNTTENKYLYQGKELNQTENLNIYDFHARQYDPLLGRFTAVDPAGQFASGYVGMANNPTTYVDPTGMVAFGSSAQQHTWSQNRQVQSAWDNLNAVGSMQTSDPWASFEREMELLMVYGGETASRMMQSGQEYEEWVRNQDHTESKAKLTKDILAEFDRRGVKMKELPENMTLNQMSEVLKKLISMKGEDGEGNLEDANEEFGGIFATEQEAADFIHRKAAEVNKEVSYREYKSGDASFYWVEPWKDNNFRRSFHNSVLDGFMKGMVGNKMVHSHNTIAPEGTISIPGPSEVDSRNSLLRYDIVMDENRNFYIPNPSNKAKKGYLDIFVPDLLKGPDNYYILEYMNGGRTENAYVPKSYWIKLSYNEYFSQP